MPCLLEDTEVINGISVKIPSQFLITKITTSFDKNFDQLIIKISFEGAKSEPDLTFENTIDEIKYSNLKGIVSAATNKSGIASFDENFIPIYINNSFEAAKFEP